jgi:hypothetical protein
LAKPPTWLPKPVDFAPTNPGDPVWFTRPVGKITVLGLLFQPTDSPASWLILAPTLRHFLQSGAFAPAWVEALYQKMPPEGSGANKAELSLEVRLPVTSAKDLGLHLSSHDTGTLLGGAQALVDQARVVVASDRPTTDPFECLLPLVPHSRRGELALTTWWPEDSLPWDIRVGPSESIPPDSTLWHWEAIADYPVGRYEYSLHEAISLGNERAVSDLLGRASRDAMLRLGLALLVILMVVQILAAIFGWRPAAPRAPVGPPPAAVGETPQPQ